MGTTLSHLTRPALGRPERYSLVALKLHTGCTHQIRVHMQSIGHPLVTDSKYAEDTYGEDHRWCLRNFLHTYHLGFNDVPHRGGDAVCHSDPVDILCPLPQDLCQVLASLRPVDERSRDPYQAWISGDSARLRTF